MPAHHFENECTGMGCGRRVDVIYSLADPVQRGRCTDGEIRHGHVVVNGSHEPDYLEVSVLARLVLGDFF